MPTPDIVNGLRNIALTKLSIEGKQSAEQGAAAIREDLLKHQINLKEYKQLEAFTAGFMLGIMSARGGSALVRKTEAAVGQYFVEEEISGDILDAKD